MSQQLEIDLLRNAHDRLCRWIEDTLMRCKAVDLDEQAQASIIFTSLLDELLFLTTKLGMSREDLFIIITEAFKQYRHRAKKETQL